VEVEHCCIEVAVSKHNLQITYKGATMQGVGCVRMAQTMRRQSFEMTPAGSLFNGSLNITFMTAPPHLCGATGVAAGGA
jgi:hypothetical protein